MKLFVASTWMPIPPDNGSQLRAFHLLRHLSARHELTLVAFAKPTRPPSLVPLEHLCRRVEIVEPTRVPDGLGIRGLFTREPRHFVQTDNPEMRRWVKALLPGHAAAIGLAVDAVRYLVEQSTIPVIFEECEVGVFQDRVSDAPNALARLRHGLTWWKHQHLVRRLVARSAMTTVVSDRERRRLTGIGCDADRVALVPNGFEMGERPQRRQRIDRLIYPGSVTYDANLDAVRFFVTDMLPLIRAAHPRAELWVTGSTDGVPIADLAAVPGVVFTGRVADVTPLIAESRVCIVPLRIGGGTRLKILHAIAAGTPVVSTSKGVEGLELQPSVHLLVADDPRTFADHTIRLFQDDDLGWTLTRAAHDHASARYAWAPIAQALERVIVQATTQPQTRQGGRLQ